MASGGLSVGAVGQPLQGTCRASREGKVYPLNGGVYGVREIGDVNGILFVAVLSIRTPPPSRLSGIHGRERRGRPGKQLACWWWLSLSKF